MDKSALVSGPIGLLILEMAQAFNRGDFAPLLAGLTEDATWTDPAMLGRAPMRGREAIREFCESVLRAFPDFHYEIRSPLCVSADQNHCAVLWKITGTNSGPLDPPGFAPTGRQVVFEGVDLFQFRDGKICRIETVFNPLPAAEQVFSLRLLPRPGSVREKVLVLVQRLVAAILRLAGGRTSHE